MDNLSYPKSIKHWLRSCCHRRHRLPHHHLISIDGVLVTALIILVLFHEQNSRAAATTSINEREKRDTNQHSYGQQSHEQKPLLPQSTSELVNVQRSAFISIVNELPDENVKSDEQTPIVNYYTGDSNKTPRHQSHGASHVNDGNNRHRQQHEWYRKYHHHRQPHQHRNKSFKAQSAQQSNAIENAFGTNTQTAYKAHNRRVQFNSLQFDSVENRLNGKNSSSRSNNTNLSNNFDDHNESHSLNLSSRNSKPKINNSLMSNLSTHNKHMGSDMLTGRSTNINNTLNVGGENGLVVGKTLTQHRSNSSDGNTIARSKSIPLNSTYERQKKDQLFLRGNEGYLIVRKYKCMMCKVIPGQPTRFNAAAATNKPRTRGMFFYTMYSRPLNLFFVVYFINEQ